MSGHIRPDFAIILDAVPTKARVLDVGCGSGELMALLRERRGAMVRGMEVSQAGVNDCVAQGLAVVQGDADQDLSLYPDRSFDVVILSQTIQAMRRPKVVLDQMRRIGGTCVVSLPNFGHWRVRLDLLAHGRMPVTRELPSSWLGFPDTGFGNRLDDRSIAPDQRRAPWWRAVASRVGVEPAGRDRCVCSQARMRTMPSVIRCSA